MSPLSRSAVTILLGIAVWTAVLAVEGDIVMKRQQGMDETGTPPAVFPHWIHRIRYKCYACHPEPFVMKVGANTMDMASMMAGESCGACHDGNTAWGISFDTCASCHKES
jgi:c(7)-type cytochrome triheme protein